MSLPPTYCKQLHDVIEFDPYCNHCELGQRLQKHNKRVLELEQKENKTNNDTAYRKKESLLYSVGGAGPNFSDFSSIRLIILSDFPGSYESDSKNLFPMVDVLRDQVPRRNGLVKRRNAGSMLRFALNSMYNLDTYHDCWITNTLKCTPMDTTPLESKHVKPCVTKWLSNEFYLIDQYLPNTPLLVAGSLAFNSLKLLYKEDSVWLNKLSFKDSRRRSDLKIGPTKRPLVVTYNPAAIARSEPTITTSFKSSRKLSLPSHNEWLYPPLPGSPLSSFIKDLFMLSSFL